MGLFSLNYVYMLQGNITKQLWECLGEHICRYLHLEQISSFKWGRATALHTSKVLAEETTYLVLKMCVVTITSMFV